MFSRNHDNNQIVINGIPIKEPDNLRTATVMLDRSDFNGTNGPTLSSEKIRGLLNNLPKEQHSHCIENLTTYYIEKIREDNIDILEYKFGKEEDLSNPNFLKTATKEYEATKEYARKTFNGKTPKKKPQSKIINDKIFGRARYTTAHRKNYPNPVVAWQQQELKNGTKNNHLRRFVKSNINACLETAKSKETSVRLGWIINKVDCNLAVKRFPIYRTIDMIQYLKQWRPKDAQEITTAYDPCGGWGDRLYGLLASGIEKIIINDLNPSLPELYKKLYATLNHGQENNLLVLNKKAQEIKLEDFNSKKYQLMLTGFPFFDLEIYKEKDETEQESYNKKSYKDWLNNFLEKTIETSLLALEPNGFLCFNVDKCGKYDIAKDALEILKKNKDLHEPHIYNMEGKKSGMGGRNAIPILIAQYRPNQINNLAVESENFNYIGQHSFFVNNSPSMSEDIAMQEEQFKNNLGM